MNLDISLQSKNINYRAVIRRKNSLVLPFWGKDIAALGSWTSGWPPRGRGGPVVPLWQDRVQILTPSFSSCVTQKSPSERQPFHLYNLNNRFPFVELICKWNNPWEFSSMGSTQQAMYTAWTPCLSLQDLGHKYSLTIYSAESTGI